MADNKTKPTTISVDTYLATINESRRSEARAIIEIMGSISGFEPIMWGPSIIGFGNKHYKYETGREGDMPLLGFSPRKAAITIYFAEGFDRYSELLEKLGAHKASVSCLYIKKLADIDLDILHKMLEQSYKLEAEPIAKPETVDDYIEQIPAAARPYFNELRAMAHNELPAAQEVLSYGIVGYKIDDKRARVFISGWKDHVAVYPIPKNPKLQEELKPYVRGKGTLWFPLDTPLPKELIKKVMLALVS
jgi:uncharacterized protein YdhG (YjbR/CyaY superfamily)